VCAVLVYAVVWLGINLRWGLSLFL